eukprot:Skav205313  [mRNA]  locus=scaffold3444:142256:144652:+ [translate_table: standard]
MPNASSYHEAHGPHCLYASMSDEEALSEVESERQLRLNPGSISSTICVSAGLRRLGFCCMLPMGYAYGSRLFSPVWSPCCEVLASVGSTDITPPATGRGSF